MAKKLTAERARQVLRYNPQTGDLIWKIDRRGVIAGSKAGSVDPDTGYLRIRVDGRLYYAHRLAILIVKGYWPPIRTDHRDLNKINNRLHNLREADSVQNQGNRGLDRNNTSGFKGVSWRKSRAKWEAYICGGGRKRSLGLFDKKEDAAAAYWKAAQAYFGDFARAA